MLCKVFCFFPDGIERAVNEWLSEERPRPIEVLDQQVSTADTIMPGGGHNVAITVVIWYNVLSEDAR